MLKEAFRFCSHLLLAASVLITAQKLKPSVAGAQGGEQLEIEGDYDIVCTSKTMKQKCK